MAEMNQLSSMQINFMTFNILRGVDYVNQRPDLGLMAETIRCCNADIIGLNEVNGAGDGCRCQAEEIAEMLGGYYAYHGQAIIARGKPYGNALVSRYPFKSVETIFIPDPVRDANEYYETRCIIKAEFENPNFTLLVSHFGLAKKEQENAVQAVIGLLDSIKTPLVLMGDFNMEPHDPTMKPLFDSLRNTLDGNKLSFPSVKPRIRIDYIFTSTDIEVLEADIPNIVASDHFPHTARLGFR